jgi:hypothetical protein
MPCGPEREAVLQCYKDHAQVGDSPQQYTACSSSRSRSSSRDCGRGQGDALVLVPDLSAVHFLQQQPQQHGLCGRCWGDFLVDALVPDCGHVMAGLSSAIHRFAQQQPPHSRRMRLQQLTVRCGLDA